MSINFYLTDNLAQSPDDVCESRGINLELCTEFQALTPDSGEDSFSTLGEARRTVLEKFEDRFTYYCVMRLKSDRRVYVDVAQYLS